MVPAGRAKLFEFQPVLVLPLVPRSRVVAVLTVAALHGDDFAHSSKFPSSNSCAARPASGNTRGKLPTDQRRVLAIFTLDPPTPTSRHRGHRCAGVPPPEPVQRPMCLVTSRPGSPSSS